LEKTSAVMTMTGGPARDRMDVNVAQVEELIPENHWVDISNCEK
jgi:hypothetical protein